MLNFFPTKLMSRLRHFYFFLFLGICICKLYKWDLCVLQKGMLITMPSRPHTCIDRQMIVDICCQMTLLCRAAQVQLHLIHYLPGRAPAGWLDQQASVFSWAIRSSHFKVLINMCTLTSTHSHTHVHTLENWKMSSISNVPCPFNGTINTRRVEKRAQKKGDRWG